MFSIGLVTNRLNLKIIVFYLSVLPQFITDPNHVLSQSLILGSVQISISFLINLAITLSAAGVAGWLAGWLKAQRYVMEAVLAGLSVRIAI